MTIRNATPTERKERVAQLRARGSDHLASLIETGVTKMTVREDEPTTPTVTKATSTFREETDAAGNLVAVEVDANGVEIRRVSSALPAGAAPAVPYDVLGGPSLAARSNGSQVTQRATFLQTAGDDFAAAVSSTTDFDPEAT